MTDTQQPQPQSTQQQPSEEGQVRPIIVQVQMEAPPQAFRTPQIRVTTTGFETVFAKCGCSCGGSNGSGGGM